MPKESIFRVVSVCLVAIIGFRICLVLVIYFVSFVVTPGVGNDGMGNSKCGHEEMLNENKRVGWD